MAQDIGFIGGGNMAAAIIGSLRRGGSDARIRVVDPAPVAVGRLESLAVELSADPASLAGAPLVVLAVKPQVLPEVGPVLAALDRPDLLLVSILAGVTTARLEGLLPGGSRVVRAMPNTPMAVGKGMVGLCAGSRAAAGDLDAAEALFAAGAQVIRCDEDRMDAVTAVSGSGPAYLFYVAEALQDAAVELGFDVATAATLVGQTLEGSVAYLRSQEGFPAAALRRQVTSKGGTTAAALGVLEDGDVRGLFRRALAAAAARAAELSKD